MGRTAIMIPVSWVNNARRCVRMLTSSASGASTYTGPRSGVVNKVVDQCSGAIVGWRGFVRVHWSHRATCTSTRYGPCTSYSCSQIGIRTWYCSHTRKKYDWQYYPVALVENVLTHLHVDIVPQKKQERKTPSRFGPMVVCTSKCQLQASASLVA